jgi:hypothetical protein
LLARLQRAAQTVGHASVAARHWSEKRAVEEERLGRILAKAMAGMGSPSRTIILISIYFVPGCLAFVMAYLFPVAARWPCKQRALLQKCIGSSILLLRRPRLASPSRRRYR